jgi:hypothetical protein
MTMNLSLFSSRRSEWLLIIIASATKLWLTAARTVEAVGWAAHDDFWFTEKARSILEGRWLGDYSHMTLIKGPGYPLWIALIGSQHIPLLFAQQLLYALACLAVCRALAPALQSSVARLALFVVLLFNPMTFSDEIATRITREGFYPALTLLVFAGVAGMILRLDARRSAVLRWSLLFSVAFAYLWHTREEGVWILPLLAVPLVALIRWVVTDSKTRSRRGVMLLAIPALIFAAAHGAIILANGLHYRTFEVSEFKEGSFLRAYGSLTYVRQHPPIPRVPVPKEERERVYAVSPAFAELRPFFEGESGANWARNSPPEAKGDIGGAMFMWAFREAVAKAGYYERGAPAAREYYDRLSREIEATRLAGRLDARPPRATLLPPILYGQRQEVLRTWAEGFTRVLTFADFVVSPRYSEGTEAALREFAEMTHSRVAPRKKLVTSIHLIGWVVHADGALDITIERANGEPVPGARVIRLPSPDLYDHLKETWKEFPPARHARFDITVPGTEDRYLVLTLRGRRIDRIALGFEAPTTFAPNVRMSVDRFEIQAVEPQLSSLDAFRLRLLTWIGRAYQMAFAPIFALAALLYLLNVRWLARSRGDWTIAVLIAALLAAVAGRILILSLIEVTSFWVFTGGYQSPSHPLLLIAGVLMACEAIVALRSRWRKTHHGDTESTERSS